MLKLILKKSSQVQVTESSVLPKDEQLRRSQGSSVCGPVGGLRVRKGEMEGMRRGVMWLTQGPRTHFQTCRPH